MDAPTLVYIVLGIVLVASLVIAYLSSRTWHVGKVILVYVIFLMSGVYIFLAAGVLKVQGKYQRRVLTLEAEVERLDAENVKLEFGAEQENSGAAKVGGIRQVRNELHRQTFQRGRVWRNCVFSKPAEKDGKVVFTVEKSSMGGLEVGTILFVFEEGPVADGRHYLGEFKVTASDQEAGSVALEPGLDFTEQQLQRLTASDAPCSLYEITPKDRHGLFAGRSEEELKALLPAGIAEEYLRDGKPANPDDPDRRVVGIKEDGTRVPLEVLRDAGQLEQVVERRYSRQLQDYQYLFRELSRRRVLDRDRISQVERDTRLLQTALAQARKDIAYRESEKEKLASDLKMFQFERDVVGKYLVALGAQYTNAEMQFDAVLANNLRAVSVLARRQLEIARQLEAAGSN